MDVFARYVAVLCKLYNLNTVLKQARPLTYNSDLGVCNNLQSFSQRISHFGSKMT